MNKILFLAGNMNKLFDALYKANMLMYYFVSLCL